MAIQTTVGVKDNMSAAFMNIATSINACLGAMVSLQEASNDGIDPARFMAVRESIANMTLDIQEFASNIDDADDNQKKLNNNMAQGVTHSDGLLNNIKGIAAAYISMKSITGALNLSDELTSTTARLNMMNDGMQTTEELQNMIMQSAINARGVYTDMAASVAKLGNNAAEAFSSTAEIVSFSELVQKQFTIAGASTTEASNAMLQLTQALGSGVLRGDELNSIFEQAPNLIRNIADYMGVGIGEIREMASEGQITADIVKNAMFAAADDINAQFEEMPMTFAQIGAQMQNNAIAQFQPVLNRLNEIANSDRFAGAMDGLINGMAVAAGVAADLLDILVTGGAWVYDNWSVIEPVFIGIAAAVTAYAVAQGISNAATTAGAIAESVRGASMMFSTGATFSATAAQYGFNAALFACPITWIVLGIGALVVALYAGTAAFNKFSGESVSATGLIGVAVATLGAHVINTFIVPTWNAFAAISNFMGNVFNNPVAAIEVLFYDMALTVIGYIANMASAIETVINKIPGVTVDITSGLDNFYAGLEAAQQSVKDESGWREIVGKMDYVDYESAARAGYAFGESVEDKVTDFFSSPESSTFGTQQDYLDSLGDISDYSAATADSTGAIKDSMDITEENLKWMKDIAEREVIDRTVFRDITVSLGGVNNNVNNMHDLDAIPEYLGNVIAEQMAISAEGVHS